jgi:hypothetical protein
MNIENLKRTIFWNRSKERKDHLPNIINIYQNELYFGTEVKKEKDHLPNIINIYHVIGVQNKTTPNHLKPLK